MQLAWLFDAAARRGPVSAPLLLLAVLATTGTTTALLSEDAIIWRILSWPQAVGTLLMEFLIPPYLLAMMRFVQRRTLLAVDQLSALADADTTAIVRERLGRFPTRGGLLTVVAFALFGLDQNGRMVSWMLEGAAFGAVDVFFVLGNSLIWLLVGFFLAWRIPASLALVRFGRTLEVDLYAMNALQPLARVATGDVLVLMGALALSTLQSLDAQLRIENYASAFLVGGASGVLLFLLPLWGVRANVIERKAARIAEIDAAIAATETSDLRGLELLSAHRARIAALSSWPIDLRIVTRIFAYVIIPPLAWIAAALVERAIDTL